jgi:hypothetical protein
MSTSPAHEKKSPTTPARLLEAVKLLSDWNKWLVTVQTAAIAAIGLVVKASELNLLTSKLGKIAVACAAISVLMFVISIALSSYLLLFLPAIAEEIPEEFDVGAKPKSLFHTHVPFYPGWPVGVFTTWQSRTFVIGISFFALTFAFMTYGHIAGEPPPKPSECGCIGAAYRHEAGATTLLSRSLEGLSGRGASRFEEKESSGRFERLQIGPLDGGFSARSLLNHSETL